MKVLGKAGITAYDPGSSPTSPDLSLTTTPQEIYRHDIQKIAGARYFVGHHVIASTGQGIEMEKAQMYVKVSVILMDANIRITRMQPHRTIYLQYTDFEKDEERFVSVFRLLQQYDPGMGFSGDRPVLLGFEKKSGRIVDLEQEVYMAFPDLKYTFDQNISIAKTKLHNPTIFKELH